MKHIIYKDKYKVYENGGIYGPYGKKLKPRITKFGYSKAVIYSENKKSSEFTHRIIAKCFIPNPENKPQVNHINGIKTDNRVENLEWVTNGENQKHAYNVGLKENAREKTKIRCKEMGKKYGQITGSVLGKKYGPINTAKKVINKDTGQVYDSASLAAKDINVKPATLRSWLTNTRRNKTSLSYL